jgi:hypothetical protein
MCTRIRGLNITKRADLKKIPVLFPVSRDFGSGDAFDCDCVRHHAVLLVPKYNGTEPDQLRGPQHDAARCDELARWQYAQEAWDQLQFGLRTGTNPQVCITTTPRPFGLLKQIINDRATS